MTHVRLLFLSTFYPKIVSVDVVNSDVPVLIGLDFLDKYKLLVNSVEYVPQWQAFRYNIPLSWKYDHIYLECTITEDIIYTLSELVKHHGNILHPAANESLNLFKLARLWDSDSQTRQIPEEINDRCNTCQHFTTPLVRFKASLPIEANIFFGEELSIDVMFLDENALLHAVDTATTFSAETFLGSHGPNYR